MAIFNKIYNVIKKLSTALTYISMFVLFLLMFMMTLDVILRNFFSSTLLGMVEMTEMAMVIIVFCGFAYTQVQKGHVHVTMFVELLPTKVQYVIDFIVMVGTTVVSVMVTHASFTIAAKFARQGLTTSVLKIPHAPFAFFMGLGMAVFTFVLLFNAIEYAINLVRPLPLKDETAPVSAAGPDGE